MKLGTAIVRKLTQLDGALATLRHITQQSSDDLVDHVKNLLCTDTYGVWEETPAAKFDRVSVNEEQA
eukprot:12898813-Prorocentrum_lima.AAC.1